MNTNLKLFREKFEVNSLLIYETEYWVWSLRPHQATLGAGILSLKRECNEFSKLYTEEFSDLEKIIKVVEPALKKSFTYDILNYLMLMMIDPQVHYHIVPRYKRHVNVVNKEWIDETWPALPSLNGTKENVSTLKEIQKIIKSNI